MTSLDADHDGMLDAWERRVGVDPANPNDATADPIQFTVPLPANSHTNVPVSARLPASTVTFRFGALIESDGVELVVERSMYANVDGVTWASGTAALGTPVP